MLSLHAGIMHDRFLFFQALILIPKQEFLLYKHNIYTRSSGVYLIIEAEALAQCVIPKDL